MPVVLDHIVLNVRDIPASVEFYTQILRFEVERLNEFESGTVPFPSVRVSDDTVIDLFPPNMWETGEPAGTRYKNLNHFCLALEQAEWAEWRERLLTAGVELHRDMSLNWGARGRGISMYFYDPDGNEIEARYYDAAPA